MTNLACQCSHHLSQHLGHRTGRAGAEGCLVEGCSCGEFRATGVNRDNMGGDLEKRAHDLERRQRQLQLDIQAFKRDLKARTASREQPSR
jgi:hypothetical protein